MNSDFILLNKTYQTNDYVSKIIINFPKKEVVLNHHIEEVIYKMVECLFAFNINDSSRIKDKYLKDYLVHLSMLNFYMYQALNKKYISVKQAQSIGKICVDLKKITYTLLKGSSSDDQV